MPPDQTRGAIGRGYEIGTVFSTDTDIPPATEFMANRFVGIPRLELAPWSDPPSIRRIPVRAQRYVWCQFLEHLGYAAVADPTYYTR